MTTESRRQRSNAKARAYRAKHKEQEAARARAWRKSHPNYAGKYVAKSRGTSQACGHCLGFAWGYGYFRYCRNKTRHESGLCWRHGGQGARIK